MEKLWAMIQPTVAQHGSFRTRGELGRVRSVQKGAIRTNCIDCLDRTNVVQGMLGRKALEALLRELLLLDVNESLKSQFPQVRPLPVGFFPSGLRTDREIPNIQD